VWQILICGKLFGTHHACAHPVSQLYNHPNGWALLLSPESWLVRTTKVYSGVGADIVMEINFINYLNIFRRSALETENRCVQRRGRTHGIEICANLPVRDFEQTHESHLTG